MDFIHFKQLNFIGFVLVIHWSVKVFENVPLAKQFPQMTSNVARCNKPSGVSD